MSRFEEQILLYSQANLQNIKENKNLETMSWSSGMFLSKVLFFHLMSSFQEKRKKSLSSSSYLYICILC